MARRMSRRKLEQLARRLEPAARTAFLSAIADVRNQASVQLLAELLEAGRTEFVMNVLGFNASRFAALSEAVRTAFLQSGKLSSTEIPDLTSRLLVSGPWKEARGYRVKFDFDITNPEAERWLREHSTKLVSHIVEEQQQAIRATLTEGMAMGRNPRQTALDVVGRISGTGRRMGGVLGLTEQQARYVASARAELSDPERMAHYLTRKRRDKRFDAMVRKAMREGRALSAEDIDKIVGRYSDRLLQLRGEMLARTETLTAMNASRFESYRQAIEAGDIDPRNVVARWGATGDDKTRDSHAAMNGQEQPFGQPFVTPSGAQMRYPGDTELGAGPEEIIGCRCHGSYRIDFAAEALRGQG